MKLIQNSKVTGSHEQLFRTGGLSRWSSAFTIVSKVMQQCDVPLYIGTSCVSSKLYYYSMSISWCGHKHHNYVAMESHAMIKLQKQLTQNSKEVPAIKIETESSEHVYTI